MDLEIGEGTEKDPFAFGGDFPVDSTFGAFDGEASMGQLDMPQENSDFEADDFEVYLILEPDFDTLPTLCTCL